MLLQVERRQLCNLCEAAALPLPACAPPLPLLLPLAPLLLLLRLLRSVSTAVMPTAMLEQYNGGNIPLEVFLPLYK